MRNLLFSDYLSEDLADGTAVKVKALVMHEGAHFVRAEHKDGTIWDYPSQNYAQTFGLICQQVSR